MYSDEQRHLLDKAGRYCGVGDGLAFCQHAAALGRDPLRYAQEIVDGGREANASAKGKRSVLSDGSMEYVVQHDNSGRRMIEGIASTAAIGSHNISLDPMGAEIELRVPLLCGHGVFGKRGLPLDLDECAIGKVVYARQSPRGILIRAVFDDSRAARYAWGLVEDGAMKALSVLSRQLEQRGVVDGKRFDSRWKLGEVSIVRQGANPEALITRVFRASRGPVRLIPAQAVRHGVCR